MKPAELSTPSDREVLVKRSFDAPANLVWQAYTEPALIRRWLTAMPGWSMPVCENSGKPATCIIGSVWSPRLF